jgi:hypothetical protein
MADNGDVEGEDGAGPCPGRTLGGSMPPPNERGSAGFGNDLTAAEARFASFPPLSGAGDGEYPPR